MSDVSSVVHLLPKAHEGFITTLGSTISSGATTVPLNSTTGLTNGDTFIGIIEPSGTNQQVFTGAVDTADGTITGVVWTRGANVGHAGGVSIVDYVTGTALNMLSRWASIEHKDTGHHGTITADSVTATTANLTTVTASSISTASLTIGGQPVVLPSGVVFPNASSSTPTGWLVCDGSAVSRATYSGLFSAVGTTYGVGDGTTTFNVPDLRGKTIFGVDSSQSEFSTLGAVGGQKSVQSHNHGVNDPGHNHALWSIGQESNVYTLGGSSTRAVIIGGSPNSGNGLTGSRTTGLSVQSSGSGANNLNPYIALNYIIKT